MMSRAKEILGLVYEEDAFLLKTITPCKIESTPIITGEFKVTVVVSKKTFLLPSMVTISQFIDCATQLSLVLIDYLISSGHHSFNFLDQNIFVELLKQSRIIFCKSQLYVRDPIDVGNIFYLSVELDIVKSIHTSHSCSFRIGGPCVTGDLQFVIPRL